LYHVAPGRCPPVEEQLVFEGRRALALGIGAKAAIFNATTGAQGD
jgi:hypothetical protein